MSSLALGSRGCAAPRLRVRRLQPVRVVVIGAARSAPVKRAAPKTGGGKSGTVSRKVVVEKKESQNPLEALLMTFGKKPEEAPPPPPPPPPSLLEELMAFLSPPKPPPAPPAPKKEANAAAVTLPLSLLPASRTARLALLSAAGVLFLSTVGPAAAEAGLELVGVLVSALFAYRLVASPEARADVADFLALLSSKTGASFQFDVAQALQDAAAAMSQANAAQTTKASQAAPPARAPPAPSAAPVPPAAPPPDALLANLAELKVTVSLPTDTRAPPGHLIDLLASHPQGLYSILLECIAAADLTEALSGAGPYSLFAPDNDSFSKALKTLRISKAQLLALPNLRAILLFHVAPGTLGSGGISDGTIVATALGKPLRFRSLPGGLGLSANGVRLRQTDAFTTNGVMHVVDELLVPSV